MLIFRKYKVNRFGLFVPSEIGLPYEAHAVDLACGNLVRSWVDFAIGLNDPQVALALRPVFLVGGIFEGACWGY